MAMVRAVVALWSLVAVGGVLAEGDPVAAYREAIARAEVEEGPWGASLQDLYLGLGRALLAQGDAEGAREALFAGMQVVRVNEGLAAPAQETFLFALADVDLARGDWRGASEAVEQAVQLAGQDAPSPDERPLLRRALRWYLEHHRRVGAEGGLAYLAAGERLALRLLQVPQAESLQPEDLRAFGAVELALARHLRRYGVPADPARPSYAYGVLPEPVAEESGVLEQVYRRGRTALRQHLGAVRARDPDDRAALAEAVALLGDWELAFDRPASAARHYHSAWRLLAEGEQTRSLLERWFAAPRPIAFADPPGEEIVAVELTVTAQGRPRDPKFTEADRERLGKTLIGRLRRELRAIRFRPRLEEGVPVETRAFVYQMPIPEGLRRDS
ncbi:MAG: hypothetical protein KatS3mg124_0581 [Porticoccaceae bacterium]|nr:MAG: hypothetical protein KatS3mg124_0581 [Porticoccaceae bacterium]